MAGSTDTTENDHDHDHGRERLPAHEDVADEPTDTDIEADGPAASRAPDEPGRGAAIRVQRSTEEVVALAGDEVGFLHGFVKWENAPLRLEGFQVSFLESTARYRWVTKARQLGFSFVMALEALARCHLRDDYTAHILSFSQAEAKEKLMIARRAYESLPLGMRKTLVTDTKTEMSFAGSRGGESRIVVHPSKAPRGRKGDVYLDELAHYVADREVYRGSPSLIARPDGGIGGQLTGCSTPLGQRGIFWEIATEAHRKYPRHRRQVVPWYLASFFCNDVATASRTAPTLSTIEAVARFGTEALFEQFDALLIEDFEQEFGCVFRDGQAAFLPLDLILPATDDLVLADDPDDLPRMEGRLTAGFDVGRTKDRSVFSLFEEKAGRFECRMLRTFVNTRFADQEGFLRRMLHHLSLARLSIDRSGIGMHLAENLATEFPNVVGENFTNEAKERWATRVKILLQQKGLVLPRDRRLIADFHAIRRKILPSGKVSFDADHTAGGHADGFWSVALAVQREAAAMGSTVPEVRVYVLDGSSVRSRPLFPDSPEPEGWGR